MIGCWMPKISVIRVFIHVFFLRAIFDGGAESVAIHPRNLVADETDFADTSEPAKPVNCELLLRLVASAFGARLPVTQRVRRSAGPASWHRSDFLWASAKGFTPSAMPGLSLLSGSLERRRARKQRDAARAARRRCGGRCACPAARRQAAPAAHPTAAQR